MVKPVRINTKRKNTLERVALLKPSGKCLLPIFCHRFTDLQTGEDLAGKIIDKKTLYKSRTMKKLLYEISIHKSLNHPNIVKFIDFFEDSKNVYIILELCEGGNLNDFFK